MDWFHREFFIDSEGGAGGAASFLLSVRLSRDSKNTGRRSVESVILVVHSCFMLDSVDLTCDQAFFFPAKNRTPGRRLLSI